MNIEEILLAEEFAKSKKSTKKPNKDLTVYYKGLLATKLNANLVKSKKLTDSQIQTLKDLHVDRLSIEEQMALTENNKILKEMFGLWTQNQRELQTAWGFEPNNSFHRFWEVPKCSCPSIDNLERLGTPYKIVNKSCLVHGK